jgi:hypothetical protein
MFDTLFVANRGENARRVIRSASPAAGVPFRCTSTLRPTGHRTRHRCPQPRPPRPVRHRDRVVTELTDAYRSPARVRIRRLGEQFEGVGGVEAGDGGWLAAGSTAAGGA